MSDDWNPNDPDATRVHYDLSGWTFDQQAELASDLAEAEIPHAWDGAELLVPEEFEVATDTAVALVEERLGIDEEAADVVGVDSQPQPLEVCSFRCWRNMLALENVSNCRASDRVPQLEQFAM